MMPWWGWLILVVVVIIAAVVLILGRSFLGLFRQAFSDDDSGPKAPRSTIQRSPWRDRR